MKIKYETTPVTSSIFAILLTAIVGWSANKYVTAEDNATIEQVRTLAAQLGAASARNYSTRTEVLHEKALEIPAEVTNCLQIPALLPNRKLPPGYSIVPVAIPAGGTSECTLRYKMYSATFTGHGV